VLRNFVGWKQRKAMIGRCQFCFSQHELFILVLSMAYFIAHALRCATTHVKCVPVFT